MFASNMIYTITTVKIDENADQWCASYIDTRRSHARGWYSNRADALSAVRSNLMDLHETANTHVVVEVVREGIDPICNERYWFKWNYDKDRFEECPDPCPQLLNFALG